MDTIPNPKIWTPEEIQQAFDDCVGTCGTLTHCVGAGFPNPDNNGGRVEIATGTYKGQPEVRVLVFRENGLVESRKLDPLKIALSTIACSCAASGSGSGTTSGSGSGTTSGSGSGTPSGSGSGFPTLGLIDVTGRSDLFSIWDIDDVCGAVGSIGIITDPGQFDLFIFANNQAPYASCGFPDLLLTKTGEFTAEVTNGADQYLHFGDL